MSSSSSEAVVVSPEQCATAPKSALTKGLAASGAASRSSSTRTVLLAVLALAVASGAMFGVVIFGNEFTKDVFPTGSKYSNSVTLVDDNDRAIATADVESYVSLLDLPLLGTAELNKVDGITFSTFQGIQHHKVTGYTFAKESATVGGSVVETPRLSLRSDPGTSIEISVRDARAWVRVRKERLNVDTPIETTSSRRLTDGGSCLANGACLYSRDELLRLDGESRRLAEGSFFARADVAAYQVELGGDVMSYISDRSVVSVLEGSWVKEGHQMSMKISRSDATTAFYFSNATSGESKLVSRNGTFIFGKFGDLKDCIFASDESDSFLAALDLEDVATNGDIAFSKVSVVHSEQGAAQVPHLASSKAQCLAWMENAGNLTEVFGAAADVGGNALRKMVASVDWAAQERAIVLAEVRGLMLGDNKVNRRHKERYLRSHRSLKYTEACDECTYTTTLPTGTFLTHFDLWLTTRLAGPTFLRPLGKRLGRPLVHGLV